MRTLAEQAVVHIVCQRGDGDCAIAAIAMYLGVSYEDVLAAAVTRGKKPDHTIHRRGFYTPAIIQTAKRLGVKLKHTRHVDLEASNGILGLVSQKRGEPDHVVLLREGLLFDTDGSVWEPDVYFAHHHYQPTDLITRRD